MAAPYNIEVLKNSFVADETMASSQYFAVAPTTAGNCDLGDLAGESVAGLLGVVDNDPASGEEASVAMLGIQIVSCGGTVSIGDQVTCDASGEIVRARPGDWILGTMLDSGVDGDQKPCFICPQYPADMYLTASEDMSTSVGYAVRAHTVAGQMALADNGESAIGILLANTANAAAGKVRTFGVCQAVAGTSGVTVGDLLAVEDAGKVVTAATGDHIIGLALATIAASATGTILFQPRGTVA